MESLKRGTKILFVGVACNVFFLPQELPILQ